MIQEAMPQKITIILNWAVSHNYRSMFCSLSQYSEMLRSMLFLEPILTEMLRYMQTEH